MSRPSPPRNDRFEDYVPVAERLERFYERFPDGRVITHIIEHNSESGFVLMRAEVYRSPDDAQPAATGHAFEVRGESYVNKTSYIENCECVPLDSEILTRRGFALYWELNIGEDVLAYDPETDRCVWTPLLRVTTYDDASVIRIKNKHSFDFTCTKEHTWAVLAQKARGFKRELRKANELHVSDRLITAARADGGDSPITPEEAAIIGWVFTDGHFRWHSDNWLVAYISQSKQAHLDELRALLGAVSREEVFAPNLRTFPTGRTYKTKGGFRWCLRGKFARLLFVKAGIKNASDLPALALRLTSEARASMLRAMLHAEGDEVSRFGQKSGPVFEAFQLLATLEGFALGKMARDSEGVINVQKLKTRRNICASQFDIEEAERQPVWCPTTKFGTWIMRQRGQITITGNTGAVGRALALLGFEVKRGIASREELEKTSRMTTDRGARASNAAPQAATSTPAANSPTATTPAASAPAATANAPADVGVNLDAEILQSAGALGYDAAKVRKWIDQKFKVTGGLDALGADDKREVLRVFREKASPAATKGTAK
ncbi:MAG: hypothetical protein QOG00_2927 [Pyrinomonadaceae bacterium]|nr:hypothetical protein [Pyrinomonadaceae bacterium]